MAALPGAAEIFAALALLAGLLVAVARMHRSAAPDPKLRLLNTLIRATGTHGRARGAGPPDQERLPRASA